MKPILFFLSGFIALSSFGGAPFAFAQAPLPICETLAGIWDQTEPGEEDELPAAFEIRSDCKVSMIQATQKPGDAPLILDHIFQEGEQLRVQYGMAPGSIDPDGNPYPEPLPEELREAMQGDLYVMEDGTLRMSLDIIDIFCGKGPDKCVSSPFVKRASPSN